MGGRQLGGSRTGIDVRQEYRLENGVRGGV